MEIFCERLKELREENNLNYHQLGKILGVGNGTVSKWEKGKMEPGITQLKKLAIFFNVRADYLLGLED